MLSPEILNKCGLTDATAGRITGGDINECWQLIHGNKKYFLKVNDSAKFPGMFEQEAQGLNALEEASSFIIPSVILSGIADTDQYLLLEWLEPVRNSDWSGFGHCLAQMHKSEFDEFGWKTDNYIGSLTQINNKEKNWAEFYASHRIMPLVSKLFNSGLFSQADLKAAENLCSRMGSIFPEEPASLLHGDLWSGNCMFTSKGPSVFDPAVYFGHREMDIGMSLLFGGFHKNFYDGYNEVYPLEPQWQQRLPLTQLYPLLVHAVLFKGHYISLVRKNIRVFSDLL